MPNHITNILKFKGDSEQVHAMLDKIKSDELGFGSIDFNKIIPMPESLNIEAGSRTDEALYVCMMALNPAAPDMGIPKLSREEYQKLEIVVSQSKGVQFMQPDAQQSPFLPKERHGRRCNQHLHLPIAGPFLSPGTSVTACP